METALRGAVPRTGGGLSAILPLRLVVRNAILCRSEEVLTQCYGAYPKIWYLTQFAKLMPL